MPRACGANKAVSQYSGTVASRARKRGMHAMAPSRTGNLPNQCSSNRTALSRHCHRFDVWLRHRSPASLAIAAHHAMPPWDQRNRAFVVWAGLRSFALRPDLLQRRDELGWLEDDVLVTCPDRLIATHGHGLVLQRGSLVVGGYTLRGRSERDTFGKGHVVMSGRPTKPSSRGGFWGSQQQVLWRLGCEAASARQWLSRLRHVVWTRLVARCTGSTSCKSPSTDMHSQGCIACRAPIPCICPSGIEAEQASPGIYGGMHMSLCPMLYRVITSTPQTHMRRLNHSLPLTATAVRSSLLCLHACFAPPCHAPCHSPAPCPPRCTRRTTHGCLQSASTGTPASPQKC